MQGVHRLRTHGRSAVDDRQPPDARDQGGLLRCHERPERPGRRSSAFRRIYSGSAGLGSRDVRPGDIIAVVQQHDARRARLLLRRHRSSAGPASAARTRTCGPRGGFSMRGHSVGGFGSVTTNKVIATIAGNVFGKDVQAYPKYGSEKKGLPTTYYLTIADSHIYMHSELEHVDLRVHQRSDGHPEPEPLNGLLPSGAIFMQSPYTDAEGRVEAHPAAQSEDHPRPQDPRLLLRHGQDRPRNGLRGRPADAHAGHRAARGVPQADAVRRGEPDDATSRCTRAWRRPCGSTSASAATASCRTT